MQLQPYLSFSGNCQEAMEFYADIFGTDNPEIILFGETHPEEDLANPDQAEKLVIRAELAAGETRFWRSPKHTRSQRLKKDPMTLVIFSDDLNEIKHLYYKLKAGGTVETELQETCWSKVYAALIDKFGVGWQLNYNDGRLGQVV